ncbi:hypothetical protein [Phytomonospora endophytica]|uniref:Uncharacterized protein n=1 Tax=Phytomonospora endophytica TaxID=714109 RepID=A0A841FIB1_9ACTN|nr:hypothetical protein [Phytomonospora endophytica]MBB6037081.1 hypothetical protein [Phytomonospora endophytica]GIG69377.1 hypothetical protein Pen01_56720 [Phytomonospora endophytica]
MTESAGEEALPPDESGDEPDEGSSPAVAFRKGGPKAFMALTCGFLALLCCLGSCVVGGSFGLMRMRNLDDARVELGAPAGWSTSEDSAWPWAAYATITGPADALAFESWLTARGAEYDSAAVASCLAAAEVCELEFAVGDRTVRLSYHGGDDGRADLIVT